MRISVTGPQGSGKTTQANLLAEFLELPMVGVGETLRERSKVPDEMGQIISQALEKGDLVDDEVVALVARAKTEETNKGFVMDGYPRSIEQKNLFDPKFDKVFYLDITDEEVIGRLLKRGREDDTLDLIKERLENYHKETEPMLGNYETQGILKRIDATKSVEEIQDEIRKAIDET